MFSKPSKVLSGAQKRRLKAGSLIQINKLAKIDSFFTQPASTSKDVAVELLSENPAVEVEQPLDQEVCN